jgi:hypothetical protein
MPWKSRDKYLYEQRWKQLNDKEKLDHSYKQANALGWWAIIAITCLFVGALVGVAATKEGIEISIDNELEWKRASYDMAESYCVESGQGKVVQIARRETPYFDVVTVIECEGGSRRFD